LIEENELIIEPRCIKWLKDFKTMIYTYTILNHYEGVYQTYVSNDEMYTDTMYVIGEELCTVVELNDVHRREEMSDN
jgi:hypothetical protein